MSSAKDMSIKVAQPEIETQCPNCRATIKASDRFCTQCGVRFICPKCNARIADPFDRFCPECGARLEGTIPSKEIRSPSSDLPTSGITSSSKSQPLKLKSFAIQESPVADLLTRHRVPPRALREIYFEMGIALTDRQEYTKATEFFQQALNETGTTKSTDILFYLASVYEVAGQGEQAFRTYLEPLLEAPDYIDAVLLHLHQLLTPKIVLALSAWITDEWAGRIEYASLTALNRAHVALLIGHIHLYLENYKSAQEFFANAMKLAPDVVPTLVDKLLAPEVLPPALAAADKNGNAHYTLAQLYNKLGSYELALQELNQALDLGLAGEGMHPEAPAMQLKAQILEVTHQPTEAAICYYEAGRYFYWSDAYVRAQEQFRNAAALRSNHGPTYWYWADALRMRTNEPESSDKIQDIVDECLKVWNTGFQLDPPTSEEYAWAYVTRARINEQRVNLPNESPWVMWWEAIIYLERAILLGQQNASTWVYLARCYNNLNSESNSLKATSVALEYDGKDLNALFEQALILANIGQFDAAEERINKCLEQEPNASWLDSVRAFVSFYKERDEKVIKLDDILEKDPSNIWFLAFRASCYRWLGNHRIFENMLKEPTQDPYFNLGLCYLTQSELKRGEEYPLEGIRRMKSGFQLDDLKPDFEDIEKLIATQPPERWALVQKIYKRLKQAVKKQRIKLQEPLSADDELKQVIKKYPRDSKAGKWGWLGAHAGLGRIYMEEKRWDEAAKTYRLLLKESTLFPEARVGLETVANGLQEEGDARLKEGKFQDALERFARVLTFVPASLSHDKLMQGDLYTRSGLAHFFLRKPASARKCFAKAIQCYRQNEVAVPGITIGKITRSLLSNVTNYWFIEDEWNALIDNAGVDESLRSELATARRVWADYLDELFKLSEQPAETPVLPIILEIGEGLIPPDTSSNWVLLKSYIPEMRERIQHEMGVEISHVRVRLGNLSWNEYNILLDENLFVWKGHVLLNNRYCPHSLEMLQALDIPKHALVEAQHPLTGASGCWIPPEYYDLVVNHKLELWTEPLVFIVSHLEAVIRRNLAKFLGMQEVDNLLDTWEQDAKNLSRIASMKHDGQAQWYIARVLRMLVQEQVPITKWQNIFEALQEPALMSGDSSELLRTVRLKLKQLLPGNTPMMERFELPPECENSLASGLRHEHGGTYFTAPPAETFQLLSLIREKVRSSGRNFVVVTRNAELRPFIWLLLEAEFPFLMVLSQEEALLSDEVQKVQMDANKVEVNGIKIDEIDAEDVTSNIVEVQAEGVATDAE